MIDDSGPSAKVKQKGGTGPGQVTVTKSTETLCRDGRAHQRDSYLCSNEETNMLSVLI